MIHYPFPYWSIIPPTTGIIPPTGTVDSTSSTTTFTFDGVNYQEELDKLRKDVEELKMALGKNQKAAEPKHDVLVEINGVVEGLQDPDTFTHEFIKWVESKGYNFAGSIGPYYNDDDNEE
jgi:hypothetical protein